MKSALTESGSLPSISDRPEADVVIYDGDCRFCRAQVTRLNRWDTRGRLAFVSLQDPEVARRWPDLTREALLQEIYVIDGRGHRYPGALALRYLSRRLPRLWWLAPLLHLPLTLPVWHALYRAVARRRYLWNEPDGCASDQCGVKGRQ